MNRRKKIEPPGQPHLLEGLNTQVDRQVGDLPVGQNHGFIHGPTWQVSR
jgi:hypothetical protein